MDFNDKEWKRPIEMLEKQLRLIESAMPKGLPEQAEQAAAAFRSSGLDRIAQALETSGLGRETELLRAQLESCTRASVGAEAFAKAAGRAEALGAEWREAAERASVHVGSIVQAFDRLKVPDWPSMEPDESTKRTLEALRGSLEAGMSVLGAVGDVGEVTEETEQRPQGARFPDAASWLPAARPVGVPPSRVAETLGRGDLTLAGICLRLQMWGNAEEHARSAADWFEESPEPFIALGAALNGQGRYRESVAAFEEAGRRDANCFTERADVRAVYEASLQQRRWDGEPEEDDGRES